MPLKHIAAIIAGQSPSSDDVFELNGSGRPFLQGNAEFGPFHPEPRLQCDMAPKQANPGDILLSVRAPVGALNLADRPYGIGRGLCAIRPLADFNPSFAWWAVVATAPQLAAVATGSTYDAVSADDVGHLEIPRIPQPTQLAIADYLDRETARIDALIAAKKRMMELLDERFWSLVSAEIESRSSACLPLRRWIDRITDGPFGSSLTSSDYVEDGARVVRLGNIGRGVFRDDDKAFISPEYFQSLLRHRVCSGDLLIAGLGDTNNHVGRACVAPDLGFAIVKADCYCASVDRSCGIAEFLALYLSSPLGKRNVAIAARGTTRSRINLDIAREIQIPLLPLTSQREIVSLAASERRRTGSLKSALHDQIALLQERRQALITAAVTGQLDIPETA